MINMSRPVFYLATFTAAAVLSAACATPVIPTPANAAPVVETSDPATAATPAVATPAMDAETATPVAGDEENSTPAPTEEEAPVSESTPEFTYDEAPITSIEILGAEAQSGQVSVIVRGEFSDGCTEMDEISQTVTGDTFEIEVTTRRPVDLMCTQVVTPFEETIELDAAGLEPGVYTVTVNGVSATFELTE